MPQNRSSRLALVALAAATGLVAAALLLDWLVVDLHPTDGPRIWIPVPIAAVRVATTLVPEAAIPGEAFPAEATRDIEAAAELLERLAATPRGTRISVATPEVAVLVTAARGTLDAGVESRDTTVHLHLPLKPAARALRRCDPGKLDRRTVHALLGILEEGFELRVATPEMTVRLAVR